MNSHIPPSLYLVDSFALAFRIFYAFAQNPLVNSRGQDNSLVHGYWGNLLRVLSQCKPTHFAVVKDMGRATFRHQLYPEYKANRGEMPEQMREQLPRLEEMLALSGLPVLGREGYEADDLMAHLALKAEAAGFDVFLVTKDKDMGQIVSDHIHMIQLEKGNTVVTQGPVEILAKFGVPPHQMRDYLALVGDASDNVPGVPKVGPKTAVELLRTYGDLDGIYRSLGQITRKALYQNLSGNREKALLSRELVTLQSSHDFGISLGELVFRGVKRSALHQAFIDQEMRSLDRLLGSVPDCEAGTQGDLFGSVDGLPQDAPATEILPEYVLIDSVSALDKLEKELATASLISVDTETDSLVGWKANLVGVCISYARNRGYYLPVGHVTGEAMLSKEVVCEFMRRLCAKPDRPLLFHNAKYDLQVLRHCDVNIQSPVLDSMLGAWLLDPGQPSFGLDDQVRRRLGHTMIPIVDLIGRGKSQISFAQVPVAQAYPYGAEDAVFTLRLWLQLEPELARLNLLEALKTQEVPLALCLAEMERVGICIDREELGRIGSELSQKLDGLEKEIYAQAGSSFNINSTQQLGKVLFESLGLPAIRKTSLGYSTDAATLEELRGQHPIIESVMGYRETNKLLNTYVQVLPTLVDAQTGRVHTSFLQTGTATGRLSSRDPNLQNIPIRTPEGKRIRAAFVAPSDDWTLLSADYSQIELRVLAHLSGDPELCRAYSEGRDIHAATASAIFGIPLDQVNADMRRQAKVVNFGVLYGMTAFRLARDLGIERSAAKAFIDGYFGLYSHVRDWIDGVVQQARAEGAVHTLTGRLRVIPGIGSTDHTERQMAERMAVNSPVQGSAADLIKIAMVRLHRRISVEKLPLRMLLQVHDELVFECPQDFAPEASRLVKAEMEGVYPLRVPLIAEVGTGANWLAAH
ncbi:MAG TPA: DNA polymerase I [Fibrobacteraceae bacterium]|nr:DNA polymerase I [Fibrobacteraceae bacterium]